MGPAFAFRVISREFGERWNIPHLVGLQCTPGLRLPHAQGAKPPFKWDVILDCGYSSLRVGSRLRGNERGVARAAGLRVL
jgi:hypothetical protein